jgi:NAD(P)-dependent dehydrogenase (short-subunit alcohol dehydrogenase family)
LDRFSGKVSIVAGGANGIGAASVRRLAAEGSAVIVADIDTRAAQQLVDELSATGANARAIETDVADETQVRDLIARVVDEFGGLDVMCNNAALLGREHLDRDVGAVEIPLDVWDRTMQVNLRGVLLGCRYAVPALQARGGGAIVNTSSTSSYYGDPGLFSYGASKGAVSTLTRHVATTYGRSGVRCNAVVPGPVITPTIETFLSEQDLQLMRRHVTTTRLGRPHDIAAAIAFLASDDAQYVNGAQLVVDGGWSARSPHWADWSDLRPALAESPDTTLGEWLASL